MVFNNVYIYHKNQQFEFDIDQKMKYKSIFKTQKSKCNSFFIKFQHFWPFHG